MTDDDQRSDESREAFAYFSNEYAQALQAFKTIEEQSSTLMSMGVADELHGFIDQFITLASGTRTLAEERGGPLRGMVRGADPQSGGTAGGGLAVAGLVTGSISGSTRLEIRIKPVDQNRLASISDSNTSISELTHLDIRIKRVNQNRLAWKIRLQTRRYKKICPETKKFDLEVGRS